MFACEALCWSTLTFCVVVHSELVWPNACKHSGRIWCAFLKRDLNFHLTSFRGKYTFYSSWQQYEWNVTRNMWLKSRFRCFWVTDCWERHSLSKHRFYFNFIHKKSDTISIVRFFWKIIHLNLFKSIFHFFLALSKILTALQRCATLWSVYIIKKTLQHEQQQIYEHFWKMFLMFDRDSWRMIGIMQQ